MTLVPISLDLAQALESMNPQQKQAAVHKDGPAVVFASAGSGKTRIITYRIALLLENGVKPYQVLAVTFTNKAAKEMRERLEKITPLAKHVTLGTFHSCCARWLREFGSHLGYTSDFVIYDDQDSKQLIKSILKQEPHLSEASGPGEKKVADFFYSIQKVKTMGFLLDELVYRQDLISQIFPPGGFEIYKKYQQGLAKSNAMDFNDLLLNILAILKRVPEVRKSLSSRYRYILVDEYQDTNDTQFGLIGALLNEQRNLFVVGDDDQSIYSWRGACPANIINFMTQYKGAKEFRLEQNYRSTAYIIKAADHLIQHNKTRAKKNLYTENAPGAPIHYHQEHDNETEAWWIAGEIKSAETKFPFQDVAIFYRTNAQSRIFEDTLMRHQIPYRISGALRFYDRVEIKDLLAYLRLFVNQKDDVAFKRIVNLPTRGIGAKALEDLEELAKKTDTSLLQTLLETDFHKKLSEFRDLYQKLHQDLLSLPISQIIPRLIESIGYGHYLKKKYPEDWSDRLENVHELASAMTDFEEKTPYSNLALWLSETSLDGSKEETEKGVSLMTLHGAKGLEFRKVFVAGLEEGLIPHENSLTDKAAIEEERRLFYVGITRAREELYLVSASRRRVYNRWNSNRPSRFLRELPQDCLKQEKGPKKQPKVSLVIGSQVRHPVYGAGMIKRLDQEPDRYVVEFRDFGLRIVNGSHMLEF